jgi:hypothetical protein
MSKKKKKNHGQDFFKWWPNVDKATGIGMMQLLLELLRVHHEEIRGGATTFVVLGHFIFDEIMKWCNHSWSPPRSDLVI